MKILTAMAVIAVLLGGCAQKNDTPEAVKEGVIRDLATKFDMSKMDVVVDSVSFRDKEADATVSFIVKGGTAAQGMTMKYVMERHDDNLWYIKSRASSTGAGSTDAAAGAIPAGHPAMGEGASGASGLPEGHPDIAQ